MRELNQLYDITNIFFFDTKQCIKIFNKHYENFTDDNVNNLKKIPIYAIVGGKEDKFTGPMQNMVNAINNGA